jgi:hypothetical protein
MDNLLRDDPVLRAIRFYSIETQANIESALAQSITFCKYLLAYTAIWIESVKNYE